MNDPDCPDCGCNASTLIEGKARFGLPSQKRRCDHCGKTWAAGGKTWGELALGKKKTKPVERRGAEGAENK